MKKMIILATIMMAVLTGCGKTEERVIEDNGFVEETIIEETIVEEIVVNEIVVR